MVCSWTAAAVREHANEQMFGHVAARDGIRSGAASQFSSCICETDVDGTRLPVIMVTRQFGEAPEDCPTKCPEMCPQFHNGATYADSLVVHTEDGTTGNDLAKHLGLRPNIVGTFEEPVPDYSQPPPMIRHDTKFPENLFAACVCMGNNDYFL